MALFIDGKPMKDPPYSLNGMTDFFKMYKDVLQHSSTALRAKPMEKVSKQDETLYVDQHEYAIICADQFCVPKKLGTDMATTCHMVALYHKDTKVAAVGHFDGPSTRQGVVDMVDNMLDEIMRKSDYGPRAIDIDLQIIGGFSDSRGLSAEVSMQLLTAFYLYRPNPRLGLSSLIIDLTVFCASKLNDTKMEYRGAEIVSPAIRGIVCDANTGEVCPGWFDDKARAPIIALRGVRSLTAVEFFPNVYNTKENRFVMKPFSYGYQILDIPKYLKMNREELRNHFSTSPRVEADNFCKTLRMELQFILDHPDPMQSVFNEGEDIVFQAEITRKMLIWTFLRRRR